MLDLTQISTSTLFTNGKPDAKGMITPLNIVKDMVDLVFKNIEASDKDKHIKDYKFVDICCKSGNFLREIYVKLMNHPDMIKEFADYDYRSEYILDRMIYGICFRPTDAMLATRNTYGRIVKDSHIVFINKWEDIVKTGNDKLTVDTLKEHLGIMKFDVVVGNPPYNNDLYLDFVQLGKKLASESVCMITPAKWQAKGGDKNEAFRRDIVPYMSDIVFYPCAQELFDIRNLDGISICSVDKKRHAEKHIVNKSDRVKAFNNESYREIGNQLNNSAISLIKKCCNQIIKFEELEASYFGLKEGEKGNSTGKYSVVKANEILGKIDAVTKNEDKINKYKVVMQRVLGNGYYGNDGRTVALNKMYLEDVGTVTIANYIGLFSSDNKEECESFISYFDTKLIRFLTLVAFVGQGGTDTEFWRFVPDPGKFDHIFTDQELYEKYGLTPEEIAIIESVIKERK